MCLSVCVRMCDMRTKQSCYLATDNEAEAEEVVTIVMCGESSGSGTFEFFDNSRRIT